MLRHKHALKSIQRAPKKQPRRLLLICSAMFFCKRWRLGNQQMVSFWISIDEVFEEGHDILQGSRQASPESEFKHFSLQHLVWALAVTYQKADCATCFQDFTNSEHGLELPSAVLGIGHGSVLERLHSGCFWSNRESSQLKRIVMSTGDVRKKHTLNFIRLALTTSELRNCRSPFSLFRSKSFFIQNSIQVPGV